MLARSRYPSFTAALAIALLVNGAACSKQDDAKPPERVTQITVASAKTMNLPIAEFGTGSETALGLAPEYDPTRVSGGALYVRLSFPEHVALQLRIGQPVRLTSFGDDSRAAQGAIREIRPSLSATTLSREVIVAMPPGGNWRPAGSIRGEVTLGVHRNAVVVPEQAIVLRSSGSVIYAVENGVARERKVRTGINRDGMTEITEGLQTGAAVAVDGAAMLSEGAKVNVRETAATPGEKAS